VNSSEIHPAALGISRQTSWLSGSKILNRHIQGDLGHVFEEDRLRNNQAVEIGERLVSVYRTDNGTKIWVVTDAADYSGNRVATMVLLPNEY